MSRSLFFLALLAVTPLVFATTARAATDSRVERAEKPVWQWTLEERLELRYDPEHMQQRRLMRVLDSAAPGEQDQEIEKALAQVDQVEVVGSFHPELILPWELFQRMMISTFHIDTESREVWREIYQSRDAELDLDEGFWNLLEATAHEYIAEIHGQLERARKVREFRARTGRLPEDLPQRTREDSAAACQLMIETLEQVRQTFGREYIDQILCRSIAPGFFVVHTVERTKDDLRYTAGGCQ